jgi:hypothetical protein
MAQWLAEGRVEPTYFALIQILMVKPRALNFQYRHLRQLLRHHGQPHASQALETPLLLRPGLGVR